MATPGRRHGLPFLDLADGQAHEHGGVERADELEGSAEREHPAVIEDRDPVAELLGLLEVVRRHDDGPALGTDPFDDVPEVAPRLRVETRGGLVEEDDLGIVRQRARERESLSLAARELLDLRVGSILEADEGERVVDPARRGAVDGDEHP